jgi:hypothetical protein
MKMTMIAIAAVAMRRMKRKNWTQCWRIIHFLTLVEVSIGYECVLTIRVW